MTLPKRQQEKHNHQQLDEYKDSFAAPEFFEESANFLDIFDDHEEEEEDSEEEEEEGNVAQRTTTTTTTTTATLMGDSMETLIISNLARESFCTSSSDTLPISNVSSLSYDMDDIMDTTTTTASILFAALNLVDDTNGGDDTNDLDYTQHIRNSRWEDPAGSSSRNANLANAGGARSLPIKPRRSKSPSPPPPSCPSRSMSPLGRVPEATMEETLDLGPTTAASTPDSTRRGRPAPLCSCSSSLEAPTTTAGGRKRPATNPVSPPRRVYSLTA